MAFQPKQPAQTPGSPMAGFMQATNPGFPASRLPVKAVAKKKGKKKHAKSKHKGTQNFGKKTAPVTPPNNGNSFSNIVATAKQGKSLVPFNN